MRLRRRRRHCHGRVWLRAGIGLSVGRQGYRAKSSTGTSNLRTTPLSRANKSTRVTDKIYLRRIFAAVEAEVNEPKAASTTISELGAAVWSAGA